MTCVPFPKRRLEHCGFTLLETITVVLVLTILIVLIFPVVEQFQRRLEKIHCIENLRSLHVAAGTYTQDHHVWPQVPVAYGADPATLASAWIEILKPYGIAQANWICPTTQKKLNAPNLNDPKNVRVDYTGFPYGRNPQDPYRYPNSPWFVEAGDVHGAGNLIVFSDGRVEELVDFYRRMKSGSTGATGIQPVH